jgi:hypothetical protein
VQGGGDAKVQIAVKPVTKTQEKWLIDQVAARFAEVEKQAAAVAELDSLYVLVGALHVLGLADAARSYQGRLQDLKQQLAK